MTPFSELVPECRRAIPQHLTDLIPGQTVVLPKQLNPFHNHAWRCPAHGPAGNALRADNVRAVYGQLSDNPLHFCQAAILRATRPHDDAPNGETLQFKPLQAALKVPEVFQDELFAIRRWRTEILQQPIGKLAK
jgi:hypothetical protein